MTDEKPVQLVCETPNLAGVQIKKEDISIAHRLPSSKKVKDRLIVKFTRRETKDRLYKARNKLKSKRSKDLPSVNADSSHKASKAAIHINESLTPYRKKLFAKILEFKKRNDFKFLWTINGKIMLRESDQSGVHTFTTFEQFDNFVYSVYNY